MHFLAIAPEKILAFISVFFLVSIVGLANADKITEYQGKHCTVGGTRSYRGECRQVQNCPGALSNLRIGILPPTCLYVGRKALICCEIEDRISFKKCLEYEGSVKTGSSGLGVSPLLPQRSSRQITGDVPPLSETEFPVQFIVGGKDARVGQFPHMAALGFTMSSSAGNNRRGPSWLCGGTLISDQHILTAAHCLQHNRGTLTSILVGDVNLQEDPTNVVESRLIVPVDSFIIHPKYSTSTKHNDIAIIKLKNTVKFSQAVKPACLPKASERMELVSLVTAHGWGLTEFAGQPSEILQCVFLERITSQRCIKHYAEGTGSMEIISSQFCAGSEDEENAKDTCEGDSGSGLVRKYSVGNLTTTPYFVIGITSYGPKYCGLSSKPGVYTNTQAFLDWIEDIVWPTN